jgi:hypothetical protein
MSAHPGQYSLPTESIPTLDYSHRLADLIEFKRFLESNGVVTQNTRIERYIQYFEQVVAGVDATEVSIFKNSQDERFKSKTDWLLYVLREVDELMWILKGLKAYVPSGLASRLTDLVSGSDFAALDTNSRARNVEFELRIASYFCQAGYQVDLSTATDIIALNDKFAFFIECKRVASASQVRQRLAEAVKQLTSRMPREYQSKHAYGYVAMDVTKVAYSHNGLIWGVTPDHSKDINQNKLKFIANQIDSDVNSYAAKGLLKCWLQIHISCLIANPPSVTSRISSYYMENFNLGKHAIAALKSLRYVDAVSKNIPDERIQPPQKLILRKGLNLPAGTTFRLVEMTIIKQLLDVGSVHGVKADDVIAALEFNGTRHEFFLNDLLHFWEMTDSTDKEDMQKEEIKFRLEVVLKMFMLRYPYENSSKPSLIFPMSQPSE